MYTVTSREQTYNVYSTQLQLTCTQQGVRVAHAQKLTVHNRTSEDTGRSHVYTQSISVQLQEAQ